MEGKVRLLQDDVADGTLVENVHPRGWVNPKPAPVYNLVVLGAGTAGLVSAAGAAGLGARVALVERDLLGGDCLNAGCVPSKGLIRSARSAAEVREAHLFGIRIPGESDVDFSAAMERMRTLRARISVHDSAERLKGLGVDVFLGNGTFTGRNCIEVDGAALRFRKAVIATGARAVRPPVPGLEEAGYLTNETVFSLTERPKRLAVIGGGPLGCELAQAFLRLGCEVSLLHNKSHIMDREDADAAGIVQDVFLREGMHLILNARTLRIEAVLGGKEIFFDRGSGEESIVVDEILVGAGRAPNVEGLNLEVAGVRYDPKQGVWTDDFLRTSNPDVYAAGDICLKTKFTHTADASARIVLRNALFRGRSRFSALTVPWCTYTDPEIAHTGWYERDADAAGVPVETYVRHWGDVDRAVLDGEEAGFVKVHVKKGTDRLLGATVVARHAGEMISELTLAMSRGIGLKSLSEVIHPYPTQAEAIRQIGDLYNRSRLSPFVRKLFLLWFRWTR